MFDFGFWELFLIMVVALLVVGPERLPGLARQIGLWIGKAKRFVNSVRSDIEREIRAEELKQILNQQQSEIDELKDMLAETHSQVRTEIEHAGDLVESLQDQPNSQPEPVTAKPSPIKQEPPSITTKHDAKQPSGS